MRVGERWGPKREGGERERGYRKVPETVPETERRSKSVPKTEG